MSSLLGAVDALTLKRTSRVIQSNEAGITCTSVVELPSLLEQLQERIRSSMGGSSSGASLASQRSILDTGALFEAMKITAQVGDWCRAMEVRPIGKPEVDLRAWHVATLALPQDDARDKYRARVLDGWARSIEGMLDRPRERDHPNERCPACGAGDWWKDGERFLWPLVTRYREGESPDLAQSMCRACAQVWGARELAYALERHTETEGVANG